MSDYDYWQVPPRPNSPPQPDGEIHAPGRGPARRGRVVRRPSFSHDPEDIPAAPRVRHVHAPDHVTYHRSASPPTGHHTSAPKTYSDHAGKHALPGPHEETITWTQQSNPGSSIMSGESYKLVDVRDLDMVDERGRAVRVREIEETHHPRKEGPDLRARGRDTPIGRKNVQHGGWRDI